MRASAAKHGNPLQTVPGVHTPLLRQLQELRGLEARAVAILHDARRDQRLANTSLVFEALEAEGLHRQRRLDWILADRGVRADELSSLAEIVTASAKGPIAAALAITALAAAAYRRLESLARQAHDFEASRFTAIALIELAQAAREIGRHELALA